MPRSYDRAVDAKSGDETPLGDAAREPGGEARRRRPSRIGTVLLAGGLLVLALFAGFIVAMVVAITFAALLPIDPETQDVLPGIGQAVLVYVVWGVTATLTFAVTWRRLRAADERA
jgi:hypothetical protein